MSKKDTRVHFMGIGGSGISAVARMAKELGYEVSGCDLEEGPTVTRLRREGIPVEIGHSLSHLKGVDLLVHTPAVFYQSQTNPEYTKAVKKGIALTWEGFMAKYLVNNKFVVAVAGTHGKGTTTAMLGWILEQTGKDPTVEVGANLLDWGKKNFRIGKGKEFVLEADEFREKFLLYHPNLLVITSVEMDHPEYFSDLAGVLKAFGKLVKQMKAPKMLVINGEDEGCRELLRKIREVRGLRVFKYKAFKKGEIKMKLPGEHIRADAAAAFTAAKVLGVEPGEIKRALQSFRGLERRFEFRGEKNKVRIYDDYAHHPTAVEMNIKAAREVYPKSNIWVVFQPHMYARLKVLFPGFTAVLGRADRVVVTDVYTRREQGIIEPSGKALANAAGPSVTYVGGDLSNVAKFVERNIKSGDVVLVMGAGDVYRVSDYLLQGR